MNKNSTLNESDNFDDYPEITAADLENAIHRRRGMEVSNKQNINLMLDADIIAWLKKSGGSEYQTFINSVLRNVMAHNL